MHEASEHAQVKYDTFVTVYMSDCDFYPRVRAAGFETLNYPQVLPSPATPTPGLILFKPPLYCLHEGDGRE